MAVEIIKTEQKSGETANRLWMSRIRGGIQKRRTGWNGDKLWKREQELYEGRHWRTDMEKGDEQPTSDNPRRRSTVNKVGSAVDDFKPFLVNRDPEFLGRPKRGVEEVEVAKAQAALLNNRWVELKFTKPLKKAVSNMIIYGTGFLKTGWVFELDESATPDKDGFISYDSYVREDNPTLKSVSPFNIIPDYFSPEQDLESSRYIVEIKYRILQDVIANRFYNQGVIREIRMGRETPTSLENWLTQFGPEGKQSPVLDQTAENPLDQSAIRGQRLVVSYEIWDRKFQQLLIFLDGIEKPIFEDAWPYPYIDGLPFAMGKFIDIPENFFGLGLPYALRDQQDELNRIRTFEFLNHRKHAARKVGYLANVISDTDISLLDDPEGSTYIPLKANAERAFTEIPSPDIPDDTYRLEGIISNDFNEIMGRDALFAGGALPSRTSAAEIRARQGFIGAKIEGKTGAVDEMVLDAGIQVLQHLKANIRAPQVVRLIGPDGVSWMQLAVEDIREEVTIELESTSKERHDPELEQNRALTVWQTAVQGLNVGLGTVLNMPELFKWVMEKMKARDVERFLLTDQAAIPAQPGGAGGAPSLGLDVGGTQALQAEGGATAGGSLEQGVFGGVT